MKRYVIFFLTVLSSMAATISFAAEEAKPKGTLIDLSAEASHPAVNDLGRSTVYLEATGTNPAELAKRVNTTIAAALETAKSYEKVKTRSGNTHTYPNYSKEGRISGWRIRSELLLESRDIMALSELLGKLQESMSIGQIVLLPSPETRKKVEDEAMLEAIAAFQAKARLVADALKKTYRIRQMNISSAGQPPVMPMMRSSRMATMEATPAPIESGESMVSVSVSGQIELPLE